MLCFNPSTINLLPSKKVMLLPVKSTLYFEVSNNWSALFLIPLNITGSRTVPTSAMLILILVLCFAVSIKLVSNLVILFLSPPVSLFGFRYSPTKAASNELGKL